MSQIQVTHFPPSFYARYQVESLTPRQIDELLANAWFRSDVNVGISSVKFLGPTWHSTLMLRIALAGFSWKKSLRKLLRRNGGVFTVSIGPFAPSPEKDALWRLFKSSVHQWVLIPELSWMLFRDRPPHYFNTWEICVYHGQRLVAFSAFDKGENSLASLEAAYDPAYKQFSLGIYTMMLEINHALEVGMGHYYPGFLPRGVPMFEYKLRPGHVEFFRLEEKKWLPWQALSEEDWLLERVLHRLKELDLACRKAGLVAQTAFGFFNCPPSEAATPEAYNVMLVVLPPKRWQQEMHFLAVWDPLLSSFLLFKGSIVQPANQGVKNQGNNVLHLLKIVNHIYLGEMASEAAVLAAMLDKAG
jgi:arginine-tRNA-protein transferase